MKGLHMVTFTLVLIGALNWGLVGLFNYNLVTALLPSLAKLIYILVGVSAVVEVVTHPKNCKLCGMK